MTWIAPGVERSEDYPARRNEPERKMLRDWLDWHRATLLRKCAGLDAAQLATRAVPPSNLTLLGLVRHMSDTERGWVRQTFRGERVPDLYYRSDAPDADFEEADPAGAGEDFERYWAECRAVDAALEGAQLDDTFTFREKTTSVRWMWQHLVEEYARHNGHADLIREAIDGSAGCLSGSRGRGRPRSGGQSRPGPGPALLVAGRLRARDPPEQRQGAGSANTPVAHRTRLRSSLAVLRLRTWLAPSLFSVTMYR